MKTFPDDLDRIPQGVEKTISNTFTISEGRIPRKDSLRVLELPNGAI